MLDTPAENGKGVSEFEAQSNTTVVLSTGHSFVVKKTPDAVRQLLVSALKTDDAVRPYLERVAEDFLEYARKITEHLHTLTEYVARMSLDGR